MAHKEYQHQCWSPVYPMRIVSSTDSSFIHSTIGIVGEKAQTMRSSSPPLPYPAHACQLTRLHSIASTPVHQALMDFSNATSISVLINLQQPSFMKPRTSGSFAGEKLMLLSCHDIYSTMASIAWHQIYQQPHYHATTPSVMPRHSLLNASSYGKVAPSAHSPASLDKRWGSHANLAIASIDKGRHHPCSDEKTDSFPSSQMSRTKG
jgi:hypothetical protein